MPQMAKDRKWHFDMSACVGDDRGTKQIHAVLASAANFGVREAPSDPGTTTRRESSRHSRPNWRLTSNVDNWTPRDWHTLFDPYLCRH